MQLYTAIAPSCTTNNDKRYQAYMSYSLAETPRMFCFVHQQSKLAGKHDEGIHTGYNSYTLRLCRSISITLPLTSFPVIMRHLTVIKRTLWKNRFAVTVLVVVVLLAITFTAIAETWLQTTDSDFAGGEGFMVELDDGTLQLARDLNNQWHATGEAAGDHFGSVSSAADVNGDGYPDVIIGANGSGAGKAYLYGVPGYCDYGFFLSETFSGSGGYVAKWLSIDWDPVIQTEGTSVKFQVAANNKGVNWVYLGPDGTADTYYTNPHGEAIYSGQNGIFWRYKAMFDNREKTDWTPFLTDVSINYSQSVYMEPAVTLTKPEGGEVLIGEQDTMISWDTSGDFGNTPVNLYYSIDGGTIWAVIAEGVNNSGTYNWTVPNGIETSAGLVKITVSDILDNTDEDISDGTFFIGYEKSGISLFGGWNFVSTPAKLNNTTNEVQQVFADVNTVGNPLYLYDNGIWNEMAPADIVTTLDGIWIYSTADDSVSLNFDANPLLIPPTKALEISWNAVGHSAKVPVSADSTLSSVESKWTYLLGFNASENNYVPAIINNDDNNGLHDEDRPMYPTGGYWLYMTSAGELGGLGSGVADFASLDNVSAAASTSVFPQLPEAYYGTISINSVTAPAGTEITAMINGNEKGRFVTTQPSVFGGPGTFDTKLIVSGSEYDVGETVTFLINGLQADQEDSYNPGTNTNLDLTVSSAVCRGNFDDDHDVDDADLALFAADFGRSNCDSGLGCTGDFIEDGAVMGDGDVDGIDLTIFLANFGRTDCL